MCVKYTHLFCLFYVLATSKVISGWAPTCHSVHSWWFHSSAPLGDQAASTMTWYPTHSHYPVTESTSPCPSLIMPSAWLRLNKYQFLSHWFDLTRVWTCDVRISRFPKRATDALLIQPSRLVHIYSNSPNIMHMNVGNCLVNTIKPETVTVALR